MILTVLNTQQGISLHDNHLVLTPTTNGGGNRSDIRYGPVVRTPNQSLRSVESHFEPGRESRDSIKQSIRNPYPSQLKACPHFSLALSLTYQDYVTTSLDNIEQEHQSHTYDQNLQNSWNLSFLEIHQLRSVKNSLVPS